MQNLGHAVINRGNFNLLRDVLGAHVGRAVDPATCQQIAQRLNKALPGSDITAQEVPALVRSFATASSSRDDRRSAWNASGPLATRMAQVTSGRVETPISAVMRRVAETRNSLAELARASLLGTARGARMALAAGLAATTLAAGVPAASYAQEIGATQVATTSALQMRSLDDVLTRFSPGQKVYAVGDLSSHGLDRLEQLLDRAAPHMTVIAVERADRTEAELNRLVGRVAALPQFQQRINAASGESNGIIVLVSFGGPSDRTASWHAGDYYRKRGSGTWSEISGAFTQAGRDATLYTRIRDVVDATNRRAADFDQRVATQAAQALEGARADISRASQRVRDVEARLAAFGRAHGVDGDVARPPIAQWRAQLSGVERSVAPGATANTLMTARQTSSQVIQSAEAALAAMNDYESAPARMQAVQGKIDQVAGHAYAASATTALEAARAQLRDAQSAHRVGSSRYEEQLGAAAASARVAEAAALDAEAAAQRATQLLIGGFAGLLILAGAGFGIANLRRRTVRKEAIARLDEVEAGLNAKLEKLIQAMKDANTYIGKDPAEARSRFDNDTLLLAEQVIKDVGSLFVMHGAANEMREQAAALVKPNKLAARLWNLVAKGSYNEALAMLKDRDVTFSPDDGLTIIMDGDLGSKSWKDALVSDLKSFKPFAMSFEKLMEAFEGSAARLGTNFSTIRDAQQNAKRRIADIAAEGPALRTAIDKLAAKASDDGLFTIPALATVVLPAAERFLEAARGQLDRNPVGAEQGGGASANRLLDDGAELANACALARDVVMPKLANARQALEKGDIAVGWIGDQTKTLSERATRIADTIDDAETANDTTARDSIVALTAEIEALGQRATSAVELNTRRAGESAALLTSTSELIESARRELGKTLNLDPDKVLAEPDLDPSALLARATKSHAKSKTQLDAGDVKGAAASLEATSADVASAKALVEEARTSVRDNNERVKTRGEAIANLEATASERFGLLAKLRQAYAPSLLTETSSAEGVVGAAVTNAKAALTSAKKDFAQGLVIGAGRELARIGHTVVEAHKVLADITNLAERLRHRDVANAQAAESGRAEAAQAVRDARDSRVRSGSRDAVHGAVADFERAVSGLSANGRDPSAIASAIERARGSINQARAAVIDDCQAHDQAAAAILAATALAQRASSYSDDGYAARSYGDGGRASLAQAAILMASGNYEAALTAAALAQETAESNIASAHSAAESARAAAAAAAARAAAQRAADEAAAAAARDSFSSSSISVSISSNDDVTSGKF